MDRRQFLTGILATPAIIPASSLDFIPRGYSLRDIIDPMVWAFLEKGNGPTRWVESYFNYPQLLIAAGETEVEHKEKTLPRWNYKQRRRSQCEIQANPDIIWGWTDWGNALKRKEQIT